MGVYYGISSSDNYSHAVGVSGSSILDMDGVPDGGIAAISGVSLSKSGGFGATRDSSSMLGSGVPGCRYMSFSLPGASSS